MMFQRLQVVEAFEVDTPSGKQYLVSELPIKELPELPLAARIEDQFIPADIFELHFLPAFDTKES